MAIYDISIPVIFCNIFLNFYVILLSLVTIICYNGRNLNHIPVFYKKHHFKG